MKREEAVAIIRKEYLCVDRDCDIERSCGKCDLVMPSKEPILEAYKMAIKALENQCSSKGVDCEDCPANEPCEDVMAIYMQGLDEGIRCAMCTNSLKSDRGCDGGCVVNKDMYKEVMNTIKNHIVQPTSSKMEQVEDAISRKAVLEWIKGSLEQYANTYSNDMLNMWMLFEKQIKAMSPITPIQPKAKVGRWISIYGNVKCSVCGNTKDGRSVGKATHYCDFCGAKMEVEE